MQEEYIFGKLLHSWSITEELYLGKTRDLRDVEMWKYNRPPDMKRVREIEQLVRRTRQVDGIIYIAEIVEDSIVKYVCFDGNHR